MTKEYDTWFRAERRTDDGWEYVGDADSEIEAAALRPDDDWAEYRIRKMRGQG